MLDTLIASRKKSSELYTSLLSGANISRPQIPADTQYNYAYYPVVFESEKVLLSVKETLFKNEINTRRYFYPSLNKLPYLSETNACPVSENIAKRVLCLPLYFDIEEEIISKVCKIITAIV